MTLSIAWVRNSSGGPEELVFCSDSRLRFGCAWDACQKVFPLPRGDCAIAFAGDTQFAYPFLHAAVNGITYHRLSKRRIIDMAETCGVLLNAINAMLQRISDTVQGVDDFEDPLLRLIFGGFCWRRQKFLIWRIDFDHTQRAFTRKSVRPWKGFGKDRHLIVLGDPEASPAAIRRAKRLGIDPPKAQDDVQKQAKSRIAQLIRARGAAEGSGLDMEPFEALRDMIRDQASPFVGGPPQLVKVYQHLNVQPFGVRWPDKQSNVAVLGRPLPHGEIAHLPVIDPDELRVVRLDQEQAE